MIKSINGDIITGQASDSQVRAHIMLNFILGAIVSLGSHGSMGMVNRTFLNTMNVIALTTKASVTMEYLHEWQMATYLSIVIQKKMPDSMHIKQRTA